MSDLGLLAGVYANVENYGLLIDRVLEKISKGDSDPVNDDQLSLARILIEAGSLEKREESVTGLILNSLLRDKYGEPVTDLKRLGESLLSGSIGAASVRQLEQISKKLEEERTAVAHRLRGG